MSSKKWKLWEFCSTYPKGPKVPTSGLVSVKVPDAQVAKIFSDYFTLASKRDERELYFISGEECTVSWIEDNFQTLSLFGGRSDFLIQRAEKMSDESKLLLEESDFSSRRVFLIYSGASYKIKSQESIIIEDFMFWEGKQLLSFWANYYSVILSVEAEEEILSSLDIDNYQIMNVVAQLSLISTSAGRVQLDDVKKVLLKSKIDLFYLADLFSTKSYKDFYAHLYKNSVTKSYFSFEDFSSLFSFLMVHMTKIIDPSYINAKKRASKYDKNILNSSKMWKKEELRRSLNYLSKMSILSKKRDELLIQEIIQKHLLYLGQ